MKKMKIYYTSDVHGYLYPTDYLSDEAQGMGLMQTITDFDKDENTLVIDGGDIFKVHRLSIIFKIKNGLTMVSLKS